MSNAQPARKRIVLTTFGSLGDLHPYIALALELKSRGHEPIIASSSIYRDRTEALGIGFHDVRPRLPAVDDPRALELIEKVMDVRRGPEFLLKEFLVPAVRDGYEDLSAAVRGADLLVTHPITFAAPLVAQKTGIPWVASMLAPLSLWSDHAPTVFANAPWFEPVAKFGGPRVSRALRKLIDALTDPWMDPIYRLGHELGLPKGSHPVFEGQYSPQLNLALFSRVLSAQQPDWPAHTHITGFPFFDKPNDADAAPALQRFLDEGAAPLVFTLGSAAVHVAGDFYRESMEAARLLGRRAVLLVGKDEQAPGNLPPGVVAFDYAPFSELFPRAAAVVHQGGVGTTGQALRAGVPTLIVPFSNDQPDNAARVARLGTSRTLARTKYKAERVAKELELLLETPAYATRAAAVGVEVRAEDGARTAVDLMLGLIA
jgi:rhamnosyltransferase subunit B